MSNNNLSATASVLIKAPAARVWEGLTDPGLIREYFFGTEAVSDWKVGSPLHFKGMWEGKEYLDKGMILASEPGKLFRYTYLSSFSSLDDIPENYSNITYELFPEAGGTRLVVTQDGIATEEAREHSQQNWGSVLNSLRDLLEKN